MWVQHAFGARASNHVAWWTCCVFLVDAAVYPVLAAQYLKSLPPVAATQGDVWVPLVIMAVMMLVRFGV